jgi:hypothetical protein
MCIKPRSINMEYKNIEFDGIDRSDAPDFCDAFICYAEHKDGTPLTEDELDALNDDSSFVHSKLWDYLH